MYKIGEFSILKKVTIKTLRYYDSIDLFKPAVIDKYTGYRYYDDDQLNSFDLITKYKDLGFSLNQIKELLTNNNNEKIINEKINELTTEIINNERSIKILSTMLGDENMKIEYKPYHEKYKIGKRYTIKDRNELNKIYEDIEKQLNKLNIEYENKVFCNFELGYTTEDIDCFIGYTLKENKFIDNIEDLEIITKSLMEKQLVATSKIDYLDKLYEDIIYYAHDNNIEIRGWFTEVYDNDNVLIYVESFDLNEENEDYKHYLSHHKFIDEIDKDLVGTYKIREILPSLKYMFNPNKQKNSLDTNYKTLTLYKDGTTNYDNIKWNKKELIFTYEDNVLPLPIHKHKNDDKEYLVILMNESYEYFNSQRPMCYLYEKN